MPRPSAILGIFCILLVLVLPFDTAAQEAPASDSPQAETTEPAQAEAPADDAGAASGDAAEEPAYPAGLDDPGIDLDELELRLLPLTADQLSALAAAWQANVQQQSQAVVDATIDSQSGGGETSADDLENIVRLSEERGLGFARFGAVVDSLAKKGGDEAEVAKYRAYRSAIAVEEKQQADWRTLLRMGLNWVTSEDGGQKLAIRVVVIGISLFALFLVARVVRAYARRLLQRVPDLSKLLQAFLSLVVYWVTVAVGLMIVLSALGVDVTPLFAVVGGASFIIAFAMQDTLGNLAAGLMIMFNRPFDEGDYITAGGTSGTVKSVSVVSTTVTTPDNQVIVIPNSKVWGDVITNTTASDTRRVDLVFGIGYDDSIEEAQQVLEEVVNAHPAVLDDPAPVIRVGELADSSVNFIVRPWVQAADYWTVLWDLTRSVKEAFDAKGISIPFPQTDMHVKVAGSAPSAGLAALGVAGDDGRGTPGGATDFASGDDGARHDDDQST
ncbi:mechanosensitive ion channel family protein [Tropicimonas marinistellae]|uniref:mechanosensitive ion channel family protein n=1 Tax=Tropicimonas marinistellae TaxID=1739787 RepID=UPI00082D223C|nr:mechanosensitive ion channel family protein [Tropicimonas marinistellae]